MTKVLVTEQNLQNIANSIRAKNGSSDTYKPGQMSTAIDNIPTSGIVSVSSVSINTYSGTTQNMYLRPDGTDGKTDLPVSATVLPANATIPDLRWTSSDPTKAEVIYDAVNATYKVHAKSAGTVTITATSVESGEYDSFTVVVATPTWAVIKQFVQAGNILQLMDVGDKIPTVVNFKTTSSSSTSYNTSITLVHLLDTATKQAKYGLNSNGAIFQYTDLTRNGLPYDRPETALEATEETAQDGVYYYGWNSGSTYTELNLTTGDTIPYGDYAKVYKSSINTTGANYNQIRGNGWNNWKYSMIRQWLNSDAAASSQEWFTPSHIGDGSPTAAQLNYAGWMNDIDQDLAAAVVQATIKTSSNTVTDGGAAYTTTDKFFLPSKEEVYANPQVAGEEGEVWDFYKNNTGYPSASDSYTPARMKIQYPTTSQPQNFASWWLRSPSRSYTYYVFCIDYAGYASYNFAGNTSSLAPACIIA